MNKKSAFSLTEILIMLTIISFIIVSQLVILNAKVNQYSGPYFTAYNAVKKTAYNVLADIYCPCTGKDCPDEACKTGPRAYPTDSKNLCKRFSEFINSSENNCNNFTPVGDNLDFSKATPGFIASNSFRFYFHDKFYTKTINGKTVKYTIIYVDLNGEKRPNRFVCDNTDILPDIVPFIITTNGDAIPVGLPIYSNTYLTASIAYPNKDTMKKTQSLTFNDAVMSAWPDSNRQNVNIPFSVDYTTPFTSTMQNKFNSCLSGTNKKIKYIGETILGLNCSSGSYNCRVIIDKHKTTRF